MLLLRLCPIDVFGIFRSRDYPLTVAPPRRLPRRFVAPSCRDRRNRRHCRFIGRLRAFGRNPRRAVACKDVTRLRRWRRRGGGNGGGVRRNIKWVPDAAKNSEYHEQVCGHIAICCSRQRKRGRSLQAATAVTSKIKELTRGTSCQGPAALNSSQPFAAP